MSDYLLKKTDPIRIRQGRHNCPRCNEPMPYRRVEGTMRKWSPSDYAWFCIKGCNVMRLDGSIDPKEDTWNKRKAREDRRRLGAYLSSLHKKSRS